MKVTKPASLRVREAAEGGWLANMTAITTAKRTPLTKELSDYFRQQQPSYEGMFEGEEGEDVLDRLNSYLKEKEIEKSLIEFPMSSGVDVHLVPITTNLQLYLLVADAYFGMGDYEEYVQIESFVINEQTTKEDVDALITFVSDTLQNKRNRS